jgi:chromosome segregation ATPase
MSQDEFKDRQELQDKVGEYSEQAERLGEEQEGHQVDLERLQDRLRALKSSKGVYTDSDRSIAAAVESAVNTRESSVETCKSQMNEVSSRMKTSLENLQRTVPKVQERVDRMEELVDSLKHSEVAVNINVEIQTHKDDIEDVKDKSNKIMQMIQIAGNIAAAGTVTANAIGGFVSALQSIGIMR